ncbi:MAG TPA: twin-arginine translocase TatA/TatE family subunit [Solirubrobacteraceae bacterium]|nr:twin-arginine translocase TatA/TatE family subunit [Solirubrobacteraceae bacterium]
MGFDNPIHIAFLLIILLLVFGAKRLPEIGRSLGDGMRGFKESIGGELAHNPVKVDTAPDLVANPVKVDIAPTPVEVHHHEAA